LCTLLLRASPNDRVLTPEERKQIRELFLVGGYSFNEAKESFEVSRRAELRLEFWGLAEPHSARDDAVGADDTVSELDKPVVPPPPAHTLTPPVVPPARAPTPTAPPSFNWFQIR